MRPPLLVVRKTGTDPPLMFDSKVKRSETVAAFAKKLDEAAKGK